MVMGPYTTAEQALQGHDLSGKTVLLTGGNCGIGEKSLLTAETSWVWVTCQG